MFTNPRTDKRRGFTLIELVLVLSVVGTVLGAVWWAASNTREMQKETDAISELQSITQNMLSLLGGQSLPGPFPATITSTMITAQVVPSTYIDLKTPTTADNPWSPSNLILQAINAKQFRISYYNVTRAGCVALLSRGTSCQNGQAGCPIDVFTAKGTTSNTTYPSATTGWQTTMGATTVNTLCGANSYTGGANSVEFDFSL